MASTSPAAAPHHLKRRGWFRFGYNKETDTANDTRNVLLIVAALITAVTFQAGVNPPGGVWQEDDLEKKRKAGNAIYAAQDGPFMAYLVFNTMALSTSVLVLISLTYRFPFFFELWASILAMVATYAAAIFAVSPDESVKFRYLLLTAIVPFAIRAFLHILKWCWRIEGEGDEEPNRNGRLPSATINHA